LVVDPRSERAIDAALDDLPRLLARGDLLIVNDAATLPASLPAFAGDARCELRLVGPAEGERWQAVLMGDGDWTTPTERRSPPPALAAGTTLQLGCELRARIEAVSKLTPRLVTLSFDRRGAALWQALYTVGRPIQYAHLHAPLELWSVQTPYASRPWAVEPPSAGLLLSWRLLGELRAAGVALASITHAAGLSATGDPVIDALLPLPERYDIPAATLAAIDRARAGGGRVIAAGTTVVRALATVTDEHGIVHPGRGWTDVVVTPDVPVASVDGLLTGWHEPESSHLLMLESFAGLVALERAYRSALGLGYRWHEFGDSHLILREPRP
jgi:S-adenosylmethionine:tRNA ribosyltransferase-isomerase